MLTRTATTTVLLRSRGAAFLVAALFLMTLALVACTPATEEADSPEVISSAADDLPETASSSARISAALDAGEIDKPTSLLYRMWAQFGDLSLPEQYRGAAEPHDLSLFSEAQDELESMPAEIREQIEPFFLRPSNPDSAFSGGGETTESAASGEKQALTVHNVADSDDVVEVTRCSQDWISEPVPDLPFRVWSCPDLGIDTAESNIAAVSEVLTERVAHMISDPPNGMGEPIPDEPDPLSDQPSDDKIDVYVLPHGWLVPYRDLNERRMDEIAAGQVMRAAPRTANTSSAYIMVASYTLENPYLLESVLEHEMFHVLQYAHHSELDRTASWVYDGSAAWAEGYFGPDSSPMALRQKSAKMQKSELSLMDTDFRHRYLVFLWFLFMQQEAGPEAVFGMWHALGSAPGDGDSDAVIAAINTQLDLESSFPEFAMRLLNADLPGDPISPRFSDVDPQFPDDAGVDLVARELNGDSLSLDHSGIPGLGYKYSRVTLPSSAEMGTPVRVTSDLATPSGTAVSIEALVEGVDGDYTRVQIDPAGTELCVASELQIVVANPSGVIDDETSGAIELIRSEGSGCDEQELTGGDAPQDDPTPDESEPAATTDDDDEWTGPGEDPATMENDPYSIADYDTLPGDCPNDVPLPNTPLLDMYLENLPGDECLVIIDSEGDSLEVANDISQQLTDAGFESTSSSSNESGPNAMNVFSYVTGTHEVFVTVAQEGGSDLKIHYALTDPNRGNG